MGLLDGERVPAVQQVDDAERARAPAADRPIAERPRRLLPPHPAVLGVGRQQPARVGVAGRLGGGERVPRVRERAREPARGDRQRDHRADNEHRDEPPPPAAAAPGCVRPRPPVAARSRSAHAPRGPAARATRAGSAPAAPPPSRDARAGPPPPSASGTRARTRAAAPSPRAAAASQSTERRRCAADRDRDHEPDREREQPAARVGEPDHEQHQLDRAQRRHTPTRDCACRPSRARARSGRPARRTAPARSSIRAAPAAAAAGRSG